MLHFEASSIPPKTLDEAKLPDWKRVMAQAVVEREKEETEPGETMAPGAQAGLYTGKKIALNFYDAEIKNVFRILMDVSGKNFVIDKDVTGKVTLSLDKPVPWDQVLDLVLRMNRLEMVYEGDIVRIISYKTYQAEKKEERSKRAEEQKIRTEEKELEPLVTAYIPINYADASADVLPHVNAILSPRGTSTVDTRNNKIIVKDVASIIEQVKETINEIDQVTPQVIIEARIVEASDSFSRELGTEFAIAGSFGLGDGDITIGAGASNPPTSTKGAIGFSFEKLTGDPLLLDLRLAASEAEGQVKIISSPKIITLDNTPASIKQGLAYPYNKLDADGNTTTEWKDIALELEVTPHITPDDRVSMKISVKNNELGAIINRETSFTTKEAYTELLVNDGDTIVIGGIRKTRKVAGESGVPFVKDIPLLGWLFKTKSKTEDLEELLIFVTPRIVKLEQRAAM
jgi:type IV pilus assembly protein PilQ